MPARERTEGLISLTDAPAASSSAPVRVFVLDDYDMIRRGLRDLLAATDDLTVVGEAAAAQDAIPEIERTRPDVAVFDIVLPDGNGIDICREVRSRHPEIKCLLLTFHDDEEAQLATLLAGALGHLTKQIHGAGIVESIRRAAAGHSVVDADAARGLLDRIGGANRLGRPYGSGANLLGLTDREQQILDLVAEGATNDIVAAQLSLPETAIRTSVSVIFAKLGLARRLQAAGRVRQRSS
ncbi:response regulator [uncultured Friedmanniella sp.]|uniref:response regulator n=1 Tax=uncultured Friedmanniella sp. TaxID=335381 RepID=UPI0035CAFBA6